MITKENAPHFANLLERWAEGETVQVQSIEGKWYDQTDIVIEKLESYRIKPTTKRVPLTREDFAAARWFRWIATEEWSVIMRLSSRSMWLENDIFHTFEYLADTCGEISADGKVWTPCWKEVK